MNNSTADFPEPDAGEKVVWRHSASVASQSKYLQRGELPPLAIKYGKRLYWVALILLWGFLLYDDFQDGGLNIFSQESWQAFQQDGLTKVVIWVGIFLFLLSLPYILKKFPIKSPKIQSPSGVPVWMSARRLIFDPSLTASNNAVDIKTIEAISTDYIMGSPALTLRTPAETYNLISSETRSLLVHLYKLRPDLVPSRAAKPLAP